MKNALVYFSVCKHLLLHHYLGIVRDQSDLHHIIMFLKFNPDRRKLHNMKLNDIVLNFCCFCRTLSCHNRTVEHEIEFHR